VPIAVMAGWRVRGEALAVLAMAAFMSLIQYPYSFGVYFCYVAPLVFLACAFSLRDSAGPLHLCALVFCFGFALLRVDGGWVRSVGVRYVSPPEMAPLALPRGGIAVPEEQALVYEKLVHAIEAHSRAGDFIYAAPDCPEIYFLAGRRNPTRTLYDFFDDDFDRPKERRARIEGALDPVKVVILSSVPEFSPPVDAELMTYLRARYPNQVPIGPFELRYRP
jgi:hypothetical protein